MVWYSYLMSGSNTTNRQTLSTRIGYFNETCICTCRAYIRGNPIFQEAYPYTAKLQTGSWHYYTSIKAKLQIRLYKSNVRMFIYIQSLNQYIKKSSEKQVFAVQAKMWNKCLRVEHSRLLVQVRIIIYRMLEFDTIFEKQFRWGA